MITINKMEDMQKYYDANINTYVFDDHVRFNCDIAVNAHIRALDINARDISARDIKAQDTHARDIDAWIIETRNIKARYILYSAVCFAYKNITCKSIKGRRPNCRHFVLDGEIKEEKK